MDATDRLYPVAFGPVTPEKLKHGDPAWGSFNASFHNMELSQVDIAGMLYDSRPITTQHRDHRRVTENFIQGAHIGIDMDTCDRRSAIPVLLKDPFVAKYGSMVYSTPSDTPMEPRSRIIFLLDTPIHQAKNYSLAASALIWLFGCADRQCKDAVRYFYGCKWGNPTLEWIGNELPLALVKDMIARYQSAQQAQRPERKQTYQPGTADEKRVVDALHNIDANAIDYGEWVSILMALHAEYGESALPIAESWARGYPGEVARKFKSFKPTGNGIGRVGIGTVFAIAKGHGWQPSAGA